MTAISPVAHDFWPSCGYRRLTVGADGRLTLTDEFLRGHLLRPELAPVPESCAAELAVHVRMAQVAVDPRTGLVTIERLIVVHDCGRMLNPKIVEGQIVGAMVQAIGAVLMEGVRYSEEGQPLATTLLDYTIPTMLDVPTIELDHFETPSTYSLGGVKGAGESGSVGPVPAIILAVADALAAYRPQITSMPLTPNRVLAMMGVHDGDDRSR